MNTIIDIIALRLRNRRKALGLTQEQLAERAGVHPTYIGQVERGEKNITVKKLCAICEALDYPLAALFEAVPAKTTDAAGIPSQCGGLIAQRPEAEQRALLDLLTTILAYKDLPEGD